MLKNAEFFFLKSTKTFAKPAHFWLKIDQKGDCEVFGAQIFSHHTRENPEDFNF